MTPETFSLLLREHNNWTVFGAVCAALAFIFAIGAYVRVGHIEEMLFQLLEENMTFFKQYELNQRINPRRED